MRIFIPFSLRGIGREVICVLFMVLEYTSIQGAVVHNVPEFILDKKQPYAFFILR